MLGRTRQLLYLTWTDLIVSYRGIHTLLLLSDSGRPCCYYITETDPSASCWAGPDSYCILPGQTSLFLTGAYILYCYCLTVADPAVTILLRQTHLLHAGPDPTVTIVPGQTLPFLARPDPTVILDPIVSCWARPYSCYCVLPVQIILLLHLTGTQSTVTILPGQALLLLYLTRTYSAVTTSYWDRTYCIYIWLGQILLLLLPHLTGTDPTVTRPCWARLYCYYILLGQTLCLLDLTGFLYFAKGCPLYGDSDVSFLGCSIQHINI